MGAKTSFLRQITKPIQRQIVRRLRQRAVRIIRRRAVRLVRQRVNRQRRKLERARQMTKGPNKSREPH